MAWSFLNLVLMIASHSGLELDAWSLPLDAYHPPGGAFSLFNFLINLLNVVLLEACGLRPGPGERLSLRSVEPLVLNA